MRWPNTFTVDVHQSQFARYQQYQNRWTFRDNRVTNFLGGFIGALRFSIRVIGARFCINTFAIMRSKTECMMRRRQWVTEVLRNVLGLVYVLVTL